MFPLNSNLPRRKTILTRTGWQAGFPGDRGQQEFFRNAQCLMFSSLALSLPTAAHCSGRTVEALSGVWDKAGPSVLDLICLPFLVIFTPLFSVSIFVLPLQGRSKMPLPAGLLC